MTITQAHQVLATIRDIQHKTAPINPLRTIAWAIRGRKIPIAQVERAAVDTVQIFNQRPTMARVLTYAESRQTEEQLVEQGYLEEAEIHAQVTYTQMASGQVPKARRLRWRRS